MNTNTKKNLVLPNLTFEKDQHDQDNFEDFHFYKEWERLTNQVLFGRHYCLLQGQFKNSENLWTRIINRNRYRNLYLQRLRILIRYLYIAFVYLDHHQNCSRQIMEVRLIINDSISRWNFKKWHTFLQQEIISFFESYEIKRSEDQNLLISVTLWSMVNKHAQDFDVIYHQISFLRKYCLLEAKKLSLSAKNLKREGDFQYSSLNFES
jgi:hypothetical protein